MVPQGTMGFNINCLVTWMIWGILEGESSGEHVDRYPGAGGVACLGMWLPHGSSSPQKG